MVVSRLQLCLIPTLPAFGSFGPVTFKVQDRAGNTYRFSRRLGSTFYRKVISNSSLNCWDYDGSVEFGGRFDIYPTAYVSSDVYSFSFASGQGLIGSSSKGSANSWIIRIVVIR